jgi:hypothetical protein
MRDTSDDEAMNAEDRMVVDGLAEVGIAVLSVYDLVNSRGAYPDAIPVLMEMLRKVKHDRIKEGVARALTVKEARPIAVPVLIAEFQSASDENDSQRVTKWTIGNALSVVADDSAYEPIVALLRDKKHGSARDGLATALCNMKKHREQAVRHLIQLLDDADVRVTAMMALGKLRVKAARSRVESFLEDPDPWVRREAKQALAKIDKAR